MNGPLDTPDCSCERPLDVVSRAEICGTGLGVSISLGAGYDAMEQTVRPMTEGYDS